MKREYTFVDQQTGHVVSLTSSPAEQGSADRDWHISVDAPGVAKVSSPFPRAQAEALLAAYGPSE